MQVVKEQKIDFFFCHSRVTNLTCTKNDFTLSAEVYSEVVTGICGYVDRYDYFVNTVGLLFSVAD